MLGKKSKVLMIDDSKMMHLAVRARLVAESIEFHSAYDGTEGLHAARATKPDLILLDVEMPDQNGFDVCRLLKSDSSLSSIPVIFLTGMTATDDKIKGLDLGAVDYVTKPFDAAELQARVRACLRTKELLDLLAQRAMVDGLTGMWNRAYFDNRLASELAQVKRSGGALGCILADIDRFKSINDTHGHGFGDTVLRGVAQLMQNVSRTEDVVCRYGGEEFVILTPGVDMNGAVRLAERMRAAVEGHSFVHNTHRLQVTCSFGVSDASVVETAIVEAADKAMYAAKTNGRNRVERANVTTVIERAA